MLVLSGAIGGNGPFTVLPCDGDTDIKTYMKMAVGHVKKLDHIVANVVEDEGEEVEEEQEDKEIEPEEQEEEEEFILEVSF